MKFANYLHQIFILFVISILRSSANPLVTKLENEVRSLKLETFLLSMKFNSLYPYCKTLIDDICGPCMCKDDSRLLEKYYCDCQDIQIRRDCLEYYQYGIKVNGLYKIHQNRLKVIQVYCDQSVDGGGWTVFQRRRDGSVNFHRNWIEYKNGFGDLQNEFWLGNENIFTLSLQGMYPRGSEVRIDMTNAQGIQKYAKYNNFQIGNEKTYYLMHVNGQSGTAPVLESFTHHNGMKFSTFDSDNDIEINKNCARTFKSGWWFARCYLTNLNGCYHYGGDMEKRGMGIHWASLSLFSSHDFSLTRTEMKMRRLL